MKKIQSAEIIGTKYGLLTPIKDVSAKGRRRTFLCVCRCGEEKVILLEGLRSGKSNSCGCLRAEVCRKNFSRHEMSKSTTHKTWCGMKQRCRNKNDRAYERYGGRGLTICKRWMEFENFYSDMGARPKGKSLDRIDNNKGYSPENCRWATEKQQANNRRGNVIIEYNGERKTISQWAESLDILNATLWHRIKIGWSIERALTTPTRKMNYKRHNLITS